VELFKRGLIIPDLSSTVGGFEERLTQSLRKPTTEDLAYARELDDCVMTVIDFDAAAVSNSYARELVGYASSRVNDSTSGRSSERIQKAIEAIRQASSPLTLKQVTDLCRLLPEWRESKKMAEFLYCCTGAQTVGADALYSHHYKDSQIQFGRVQGIPDVALHLAAAKSLFSYFAVDIQKLASLDWKGVLKLREDSRIRNGVQVLGKLVEKAKDNIANGKFEHNATLPLRDASEELRLVIQEACAKQAKREAVLSTTLDTAFDLSGIPFSSIAKKGVTKIEGWLAGSKAMGDVGGVARRMTPLTSFASLVQEELKGGL
jgi:hypothetical protein